MSNWYECSDQESHPNHRGSLSPPPPPITHLVSSHQAGDSTSLIPTAKQPSINKVLQNPDFEWWYQCVYYRLLFVYLCILFYLKCKAKSCNSCKYYQLSKFYIFIKSGCCMSKYPTIISSKRHTNMCSLQSQISDEALELGERQESHWRCRNIRTSQILSPTSLQIHHLSTQPPLTAFSASL